METYRNEQTEIKPVADPDISFGGKGARSARIEAPMVPRG